MLCGRAPFKDQELTLDPNFTHIKHPKPRERRREREGGGVLGGFTWKVSIIVVTS